MVWHPHVVHGAMHSAKEWNSALWLNAVHSGKKWWIQEFVPLLPNIFFLNTDYVAACSQWCDEIHELMYLNWDWNNFSLNDPCSYECYLSRSDALAVLYQSSYQANWGLVITLGDIRSGYESRGLFLKNPETFRAHFGWHNSLYIFKTKASRGTKLCSYFNFYSLYNIWTDHLYRESRLEFHESLFGPKMFLGLSRNGPQFRGLFLERPETFRVT